MGFQTRSRQKVLNGIKNLVPFKAASVTGSVGTGGVYGVLPAEYRAELESAREAGTLQYVVFSYKTPIAWLAGGTWTQPAVKYSVTTTHHQGVVAYAIAS